MKTDEQIAELIQRKQFDGVRYACIERLKHNHLDTQAWVHLGESMLGLRRGHMAELCFERVALLEPRLPWRDRIPGIVRSVESGRDDNAVLKLLATPTTSVSAVILTRDSSRTIRACIEALTGAVDEVIVVDTGSADDTVRIVTELGVPVHHFEWNDNFAGARNFAQSLVTSKWAIAIDSDEILYGEDSGAIRTIAGIFDKATPSVIGILQVNDKKDSKTVAVSSRMYPVEHFEWHLPIHEQPKRKGTAGMDFDTKTHPVLIRVHHDGYHTDIVDMRAKLDRNITILRKSLRDDPDNVGLHFFLGRELAQSGTTDDAISHLERAYELGRQIQGFSLLPGICSNLYESYMSLGKPEMAKGAADRLMNLQPSHPHGWFMSGLCAFEYDRDFDRAETLFAKALETSMTYRGAAIVDDEIKIWKAMYWLGRVAEEKGDAGTARQMYQAILASHPEVTYAAERLKALG